MQFTFKLPDDISQELLSALDTEGFKVNPQSEKTEQEQRLAFLTQRLGHFCAGIMANNQRQLLQTQIRSIEPRDLSLVIE